MHLKTMVYAKFGGGGGGGEGQTECILGNSKIENAVVPPMVYDWLNDLNQKNVF